jgi:hypothetical protein
MTALRIKRLGMWPQVDGNRQHQIREDIHPEDNQLSYDRQAYGSSCWQTNSILNGV